DSRAKDRCVSSTNGATRRSRCSCFEGGLDLFPVVCRPSFVYITTVCFGIWRKITGPLQRRKGRKKPRCSPCLMRTCTACVAVISGGA
ncbi:hypothetical protein XENOCAPTIV_006597, partial [Xenoophorus captivus]